MALQIGQLRKNNISSYLTNITGYSFNNQNLISNVNLLVDMSYYLNMNVQSNINTTIRIYLTREENNDRQFIKEFNLLRGVQTVINMIISPNSIYTRIELESSPAATLTSSIVFFQSINNILNDLDISQITKIGIQGSAGLTFCLNGEEIKVGRFGTYEPIKNIPITYVGFVVQNDSQYNFIMDYQY